MHTPQRLSGILAALAAVVPLAANSAAAKESAAVSEAAVDRIIYLNRKAYADLRDQHFQAAKYRLSEALVISETAGLENDEMTARTYVHLAVVYLTGLKDRDEAIQQFMLALQINPNITITPGLESPALKSAYLQAREQLDLPPNPDATALLFPQTASSPSTETMPAKVEPNGRQPVGDSTGANNAAWNKDPDLPARVPSPLYCHLPFDTPPGQDVAVRCLTQKLPRKSTATFHYRPQGSDDEYVGLPMERSPKGWLMGVIPGRAVQGKSLSYYVKAEIPGSSNALFLGHPEAPNELIIRTLPAPEGVEESTEQPDTIAEPTQPGLPPGAESPRPGRLRAPGSFWIALGGGTGAVYHRRETVDSDTKILNTTVPVSVQSGFSPATLFQVEPEIGYQISRRFSISVMGRYQRAPEDASDHKPEAGEKTIPGAAYAGFLRGQFAFLSRSRFQAYASGGAGLGTSFLAIVSKRCGEGSSCTLDHGDTIHGGPVGLTAGLGAIYHVVPSFGIFLELKEIATLPKFMALSEINVGLAFAHRFQGSGGQQQAGSTGRASWR